MKNFKRLTSMLLAVIMVAMTLCSTTAFAAERTNVIREIRTDTVSISTSSSKTGYAFVCPSSELMFELNNPNSNTIIAVRLHNQTTNTFLGEWQTNKGTLTKNVNVTPGNTYIFEYLVAYGSGSVTVTNKIYEYYRNN